MRINRREFLQLTGAAAAGVALGPLAGCGSSGGGSSSASGTLTVWGFTGAIEGVQNQIKAFEKKYPKVNVKLRLFSYDDIHANLLSAILSGTGAPDLASIDDSRLASYVEGLAPMNAHLSQYQSQFVPPTISLSSYRGNFYGLVTDSEPMGMLYRKDLWDQYGLNADAIETWDDLAAASAKMQSASGGKVHLYALNDNDTAAYEILAVEQGFGGFYFDTQDRKVIVDQPAIIDAVTALKRLWDAPGVLQNPSGGYSGNAMTALLKKGTIATCIVSPGWYPQTLVQNMPEQAGKWRLTRVPAVTRGGRRAGYQYPTVFVVPNQSNMKSLAWELEVMGLTGVGARHLYAVDHVLPAWAPFFDELKAKPDPFFGGQKVVEVWNAIAHDCPPIAFGKGFLQAQSIVSTHLTDILTGKVTPAVGMKTAASELRSKLHLS
ncbi:MAG TPA: extracellular solute-binding protein [Chloroflexota bacterium]|nr:extracellular solute-binding protein [Chloroflexota bacterium]